MAPCYSQQKSIIVEMSKTKWRIGAIGGKAVEHDAGIGLLVFSIALPASGVGDSHPQSKLMWRR
jgi:hypothetical protein